MKKLTSLIVWSIAIALIGMDSVSAQNTNNFKKQFSQHFDYASRVLSLAEAIPADNYSWRPGDDVYSIERVFTHIARYNFYYLESSFGVSAPDDIDVDNIESITGKEEVVEILERSIDHVKKVFENMPDSKLKEETEMYGRTVNGQAVLMQLITHKSEHVGQAIAYARMNGIVPPWSE